MFFLRGGFYPAGDKLGKVVVVLVALLFFPVDGSLISSSASENDESTIDFCELEEWLTAGQNAAALAQVKIKTVTAKVVEKKKRPKTSEQLYYPIVVKISSKYQVDPLLVKAVIVAESGFNAKAVSRVGAQGLMQLMPRTAKELGVVDSFNPEHNIDGGVKYLKKLLDKYQGDVEIALAAYNAGCRNVRKYNGVPPFKETRRYVKKISTLHELYKKSTKEPLISQS